LEIVALVQWMKLVSGSVSILGTVQSSEDTYYKCTILARSVKMVV